MKETVEQAAERYADEIAHDIALPTLRKRFATQDFLAGANWQSQQDGWVSVENQKVPVMEHINVWDGVSVHNRLFSRGYDALSAQEFISRTNVTHWQPLPAKPKELNKQS